MTTQFHDDRRPDELYVTAVEYLLGLLEPEEAKAFTEQMAADESVRQAVKDATKNTTLLAEALPPREPASRVEDQVPRLYRIPAELRGASHERRQMATG